MTCMRFQSGKLEANVATLHHISQELIDVLHQCLNVLHHLLGYGIVEPTEAAESFSDTGRNMTTIEWTLFQSS